MRFWTKFSQKTHYEAKFYCSERLVSISGLCFYQLRLFLVHAFFAGTTFLANAWLLQTLSCLLSNLWIFFLKLFLGYSLFCSTWLFCIFFIFAGKKDFQKIELFLKTYIALLTWEPVAAALECHWLALIYTQLPPTPWRWRSEGGGGVTRPSRTGFDHAHSHVIWPVVI